MGPPSLGMTTVSIPKNLKDNVTTLRDMVWMCISGRNLTRLIHYSGFSVKLDSQTSTSKCFTNIKVKVVGLKCINTASFLGNCHSLNPDMWMRGSPVFHARIHWQRVHACAVSGLGGHVHINRDWFHSTCRIWSLHYITIPNLAHNCLHV